MAKLRLDVALTQRGLAESRQKAQALIMAGEVYVNGQKVHDYPWSVTGVLELSDTDSRKQG